MKNFTEIYVRLRRRSLKQYGLLTGCCFFSVLLITAYACMMRSPTTLNVLPEGGDSRKQVMMVFVLAVIGCAVFSLYAANLFFRYKSREAGIFLALGARRSQLKRQLMGELALMALTSCGAGAVLGGPLALGLWQLFRLAVVDTQEMSLSFDMESYGMALAFSIFVTGALFILGHRSVMKTNIIDVIQESHKSEPVKEVPHWYGWCGIAMLVMGDFWDISPQWCL